MTKRRTPSADRPRVPKEYGVPKKADTLVSWAHVEERLAEAMVYWIATSGPGGTPRVRPLDGLYVDGTLYVGGSPETRWARDLETNPRVSVHLDGGTDVGTERGIEGSSPQNQFALRSSIDLPHGFEFDAALRYVDSLPALHVPGYLELDLRLAWRLSENVEFSIVGHNLLDNSHPEFKPTIIATQPAEIERSIYGKITVRF